MWKSDEIEIVEYWREVWWNIETDAEWIGAVTGTPWMPLSAYPTLERRRIQEIYGRPVHKNCGGNLEVARVDNCTEGFTLECLKCGKRFCANV